MLFFDTVDILHQPTNGKPAPFYLFFCSRDMTDTVIRKNTNVAVNCLEKRRGAGLLFCCTRGSNAIKTSDRNWQN